MRKAKKRKSADRGQTSVPFTQAAPTKGWISSENIIGMDPESAYLLDNWFPETNSIVIRAGFAVHSSVPGFGPVETLMAYQAGGSDKLFAVSGGGIYDVTIDSMASDPFINSAGMKIVPNQGFRDPRMTMSWLYNFKTRARTPAAGPF